MKKKIKKVKSCSNGMVPAVLKVFEHPDYLKNDPKTNEFIRKLSNGEFKDA